MNAIYNQLHSPFSFGDFAMLPFINKDICGDTRMPRLPSEGFVVPPAITSVGDPSQTMDVFAAIQRSCADDEIHEPRKERATTDFNYGQPMDEDMGEIQKALLTSSFYRGISAHGPGDHYGHGLHSQASITLDDAIVKFRRLMKG